MLSATSWFRRFGVQSTYALLTPLWALTLLGIALNSMLRVLIGRPLAWKGRSYHATVKTRTVSWSSPLVREWFVKMGRALLAKTPRAIIEDSALAVSLLPIGPIGYHLMIVATKQEG